ncbi:hypothetical protein AAX09_00795 [Moraxella bovoculi]|nr:hypothetical protein AAX09_00795 [Moraxella bovoculi]
MIFSSFLADIMLRYYDNKDRFIQPKFFIFMATMLNVAHLTCVDMSSRESSELIRQGLPNN